MMRCTDVQLLLGAFHDGEIEDLLVQARVADHLESCSECRAASESLTSLSDAVKRHGVRFAVPESLLARTKPRRAPKTMILVAAALAVSVGTIAWLGRAQSIAEEATLSSHVASLSAGPLIQVASGDRHTVKPWFQGKVDFSPTVPTDLGPDFELVGGRLDRLQGRSCAVLVYRHGAHVINVYVAPVGRVSGWADTWSRRGFSWRSWSVQDLEYGAVTDASPSVLASFESAFRSAASRIERGG